MINNQIQTSENKGIDWSKKNIYDAIGRPDLRPLRKEDFIISNEKGQPLFMFGLIGEVYVPNQKKI